MGYIGQQNLPDKLGEYFLTIIISTVVINEMLGPVLLKYIFVKSGEAKVQD